MTLWISEVAQKVGVRTHRHFRLLLRFFSLALGLPTGFMVALSFAQARFSAALAWYVPVGIATLVEFIAADVLADRSFPFDTERKLQLMNAQLGSETIGTISNRLIDVINGFRACDASLISATVHVITELSSTADQRIRKGMLQLTEYVGPEGGRKGRITLITQGIVGRCARTGKIETVNFGDREEYSQSMVSDFGFTKEEAAGHTTAARSYLAVPFSHQSKVLGVIYFFSTEPQVFPHAADKSVLSGLATEFANYLRHAKLV